MDREGQAVGHRGVRAETLEATSALIAETEGKPIPRQLDGVQILRGAAASLVVFHHFCLALRTAGSPSAIANFHRFAWVGASGVDIFFCISGFVIVYSLLQRTKTVSWNAFLIARIKRIVPLYWLFTLLLIAMWLTGRVLKSLVVTPDLTFRSLFFLPVVKTFVDGGTSEHPILDQGWTLQYEAVFYLCCTIVIAALGSRRVFPWTPLTVGLLALITAIVPGAPAYLHDPLLLEFAGGTLLGWASATGRLDRLPAHRALAWTAIIVGAISLLLTSFMANAVDYRVLVWGVPGFLIVLGCILVQPRRGNLITDAAIWLGAASYSIYLAHGVITLFVSALLKSGRIAAMAGDLFLIGATIATIAVTALVYPLIEKPLTKWIR